MTPVEVNSSQRPANEFGVWSNGDVQLVVTRAVHLYVDDQDAPYGFLRHEVRVAAGNRREALAAYRALR